METDSLAPYLRGREKNVREKQGTSSIQHEGSNLEPDLTLTAQTVAYLEVSASEAKRLCKMPTAVTSYQYKKLDGTYILPPILYPDGKYYLKLGHHDHFEAVVDDPETVENWYRTGNGDPEAVEVLADFIKTHLIPSIDVISIHGGCCVTTNVS